MTNAKQNIVLLFVCLTYKACTLSNKVSQHYLTTMIRNALKDLQRHLIEIFNYCTEILYMELVRQYFDVAAACCFMDFRPDHMTRGIRVT